MRHIPPHNLFPLPYLIQFSKFIVQHHLVLLHVMLLFLPALLHVLLLFLLMLTLRHQLSQAETSLSLLSRLILNSVMETPLTEALLLLMRNGKQS